MKNIVKSARKSATSIAIIIAIVMFALFYAVGFIMMAKDNERRQYMVESTGVIYDIQIDRSSDDDSTDYDVYIKYEVDGTEYICEYDHYSASMKEGDEIKLFYDSRNPKIITSSTNAGLIMILFISGFAVIFILIMSICEINSRKMKRAMLTSGERHRVRIEGLVDEYLVDIDTDLEKRFCPKVARIKVMFNDTPYYSEKIKYTKSIHRGDSIDLYFDRAEAEEQRSNRVAQFRGTDNIVSGYYIDLESLSTE